MPENESLPLVTIGIPTYNRIDGYFPVALAAALDQDYPNLEIVVCDNASTDGTEAYMNALDDARVRYVRHDQNVGANGNYNSCLEVARGDYFLLLHDDDLIAPNFVSRCVAALGGDHSLGLVRTGAKIIDEDGRVTGVHTLTTAERDAAGVVRAWFDRQTSFYYASTLFNTACAKAVGGFHSPHNLYQDVKAIIQVMARYGRVDVAEPLASYRWHGANRGSFQHVVAWAEDSLHLLDVVAAEFPEAAEDLRRRGSRYLCEVTYRRAAVTSQGVVARWRAYRQVERMFGGAASPLAYELHRLRYQARNAVVSALRGLRARVLAVGSGDAVV